LSDSAARDHPLIFRDMVAFVAAVERHAKNRNRPPKIYTHQQVALDQRGSVVAKVRALLDASNRIENCQPVFLWIDTDRSGANSATLRLHLPTRDGGRTSIRFAPAHVEKIEPHYIEMESQRFHAALNAFRSRALAVYGETSQERIEVVSDVLSRPDLVAYVDRLIALVERMHEGLLGGRAKSERVSSLLTAGYLDGALAKVLAHRSKFVDTWNTCVTQLEQSGVDPAVGLLRSDYLPLFGRDPARHRVRLCHRMEQASHVAVMQDGGRYASLGQSGNEITDLSAAGWSPNVSLPILTNHLFDGMIVGRSSASYMRVQSQLIREVCGEAPVPMFLPPTDPLPGAMDSLLDLYLRGGHMPHDR